MKFPIQGAIPPSPGFGSVSVDTDWLVQGRVLPGSYNPAGESVLYLQAKHTKWEDGHFHSGHAPVMPDLGLEIAMAILMPFHNKFATDSLDDLERRKRLPYTFMARLEEPKDSIAFISSGGMTIVIQLPGIEELFTEDDECEFCTKSPASYQLQLLNPSEDVMSSMMEMVEDERSH